MAYPVSVSAELRLRDGVIRIAVVSDTHGRPHPRCAALIAAERPDHILHAGDVGDLAVLDRLSEIAPVSAVRGNIDAPVPELPETRTITVHDGDAGDAGDGRLITLLLLHIGVDGTKLRADARRLAEAAGASMVICGHSHVPFIGRDRGLTIFNPGSAGPRRFQLPIVFGILDVSRQRVTMEHVDCETGLRWQP
jgi:putative phosphoesterase